MSHMRILGNLNPSQSGSGEGGGGVTDHGALTGRDANDVHPVTSISNVGSVAIHNTDEFAGAAPFTANSPTAIVIEETGTAVATYNTEGTYDDYVLSEPGNAIYDPITDKWIVTYTAQGDGDYKWRAFAATSATGDTEAWTTHPQNPISGTTDATISVANSWINDPYIAKDAATNEVWRDSSGRALMFCEERMNDGIQSHRGVCLFRSGVNTLDDWTAVGRVLDAGIIDDDYANRLGGDWDDLDRVSPTVFHDGTQLVMLYEGRSNYSPSDGQVGVAYSADEGVTWTPAADPIIGPGAAGSWNEIEVVPDDVVKVDHRWIMWCHGYDDSVYTVGRYVTTDDPADWDADSFTELPGNPIQTEFASAMQPSFGLFNGDPTRVFVIDDTHNLNVYTIQQGGAGVTDHGALTGLTDDDHSQYHNDARGDARYAGIGVESIVTGHTSDIQDNTTDIAALQALNHWQNDAVDAEDGLVEADLATHREAATGTLTDFSVSAGGDALDVSSDLDIAGGLSFVFDWTANYFSVVLGSVPITPDGLELVGMKWSGFTAVGGDLADVSITLGVADAVTFAYAGNAATWAGESDYVVVFDPIAATEVGSIGVGGYVFSLSLGDETVGGGTGPTSVTVDSVEFLYRNKRVDDLDAADLPYTPTTSGDWDVSPAEVMAALDELASRVRTLEP